MINANLRKKGLIGIAIAAALIVGTLGAHNLQAAGRVDTTRTVKITAAVEDGSVFANKYNDILEIDLYKIATLDVTGRPTLTEDFNNGTIDLSVLGVHEKDKDIKIATIEEKVVNPAKTIAATKQPTDVIELNRKSEEGEEKAKTASVEIEEGAGIYLYIPKTVTDAWNSYEFTSYIIYAPTSEYIMSNGEGSDEWQYESRFTLKPKATPLYGSLKITKHLDKFNENLQSQSFVYTVKAVLDEKTVLNSVYKIDFTGAGDGTKVLDKIPAGAAVTVTESYTGSSYETSDGQPTKTTTIFAGQQSEVTFNNTYNGKNIIGGIAAENRFVVKNGVTYWYNAKGEEEAQTKQTSVDQQPEAPQVEVPQ